MKREAKIFGLSYAQSQIGSYVAILDEVRGTRKLAVLIRPFEAQMIAQKIEKVSSRRPMTHEVLKSLTDSFNMDVQEVVIYNVAEGIFYTKLVCSDGIDIHNIECSAGDGIAFSLVYDCPIWIEESVLESSGIEIGVDENGVVEALPSSVDLPTELDPKQIVELLNKKMIEALANEEYEEAAKLRDEIKDLESGSAV